MKIITVASAKGGVGKSTFCCGVGQMLAAHGKKVLLADMDIGVRSLDILLGVSEKTVYNWGDIIKGNCDCENAVAKISENLFLLPAPVDFGSEYTSEEFKKLTDYFGKKFDYIFLDAPAGLESGFALATAVSDSCIIMSTPDTVSVRAASYASENVRKVGVNNVRLVINRYNKKVHKSIDVDEIIDTVGARLLGIIPESQEIYRSANGGRISADSKASQSFLRISKRILGENVPFRAKNF